MAASVDIARRTGLSAKADARIQRAVAEHAASRPMRDCLSWIYRSRSWINEQQLEICRIPAPTFLEEKRAEWMAAQLRSLGWDARVDRAGNVIALEHVSAASDGPLVALTAHLDTVLAPRRPEDIRIDSDGRFRGPGVADNGAGLAGLLAVAASWKKSRPLVAGPASLLLVANVCEEGEGNLSGMRYLCRQSPLAERIRSFVVLDGPSTDHITCQALASRRFEIIVNGPGGHSWSDQGNGNPVHALSRVIHYFSEGQYDASPMPRSSFNFGTVEGGVSVNSIPSEARAKLDVRSEDPDRIDSMARCLAHAVDRAIEIENYRATGGKVSVKVREIGSRPGGILAEDSPLLKSLRAVDAHLGIRAQLDCASTDANIPLSMGLEAVSIGAGGQGAGAHTPEEWFDPDKRELGLQRILLTVCLLLDAAAV